MRQPSNDRRKSRVGKGVLPPNSNQWENEHNGLDLRDDLGLSLDVRLSYEDAFALLEDVTVLPHGGMQIEQKYIDHFRNDGSANWSGMGIPLPGGGALVVYNDSHPPSRIRSTLMEEFFHLRLGHPATTVRVYEEEGSHRSYNAGAEGMAYGSGAASLVPYHPLYAMLALGKSAAQIARHFDVSRDLVVFRLKVTRLYRKVFRR